MDEYVKFQSISRDPAAAFRNDGRVDDEQFDREMQSGLRQQSGVDANAQNTSDREQQVFFEGYLAGRRAAQLTSMPTMDAGSLVGGMGYDTMGSYAMGPNAMGANDIGAPYGMQGSDMSNMGGIGPGAPDASTGAIDWLNKMMQLLDMIVQLKQLAGQLARGPQSSEMMTPGGPGRVPPEIPEMSIMPVGNHTRNVTDGISRDHVAPDGTPPSGARDLNLTPYQREVNEATFTGEGSIPLITETPPSEEGYMAGPFSYGELNEILDYAMTDPTAMREATFAGLSDRASDRGAPDNIMTAYEELFDLLDSGDEEGFRNAFLNLGHTDLGEFPVWGAVDVANAVRREEEGSEPSNPALDDLDGNIADGLPIDMNASEELATEDMLEEEAA